MIRIILHKITHCFPVRGQLDAWRLGFRDGRGQYPFSSGLTWRDNQDANESYDAGVNAGQITRGRWNG